MEIDVSVIIPTYNHEKYIEKAIRSVLDQKVNFNMEVFIGEDCSTDKTKDVLKKIEPELPDNFHILYREKNLNDGNFTDLYSRMNGRYFIILEGDDYWIYNQKLQKQFDFLETHPDYVAVAHNARVVDENDRTLRWRCHECYKEEYTINDFKKGLFPGQTATVMRRNYFKYNLFDYNIDIPGYPGDRLKAFLMVANGRVHCIQEEWSAYRLVVSHGSSYAATSSREYDKDLLFYNKLFDYARRNNCRKEVRMATEELLMWFLFGCMLLKRCNVGRKKFFGYFGKMKYKGKCGLYIFQQVCLLPKKRYIYIKECKQRNSVL